MSNNISVPNTIKCILGLDLASTTGWAFWEKNGPYTSGTWDFTVKKNESDSMRLIKLRTNLDDFLANNPLLGTNGLVSWEEVNFVKYRLAYRTHEQLVATLTLWCTDNQIPFTSTPVGRIKKYATGKGNASKYKMAEAAQQKWPKYNFIDDNEVDASWVVETKRKELNL